MNTVEITPVDDVPLHGLDLGPDQWWACHQPERPPISHRTYFDERCDKCVIMMRTAHLNGLIGTERGVNDLYRLLDGREPNDRESGWRPATADEFVSILRGDHIRREVT